MNQLSIRHNKQITLNEIFLYEVNHINQGKFYVYLKNTLTSKSFPIESFNIYPDDDKYYVCMFSISSDAGYICCTHSSFYKASSWIYNFVYTKSCIKLIFQRILKFDNFSCLSDGELTKDQVHKIIAENDCDDDGIS